MEVYLHFLYSCLDKEIMLRTLVSRRAWACSPLKSYRRGLLTQAFSVGPSEVNVGDPIGEKRNS